jgi:hypothetical protein
MDEEISGQRKIDVLEDASRGFVQSAPTSSIWAVAILEFADTVNVRAGLTLIQSPQDRSRIANTITTIAEGGTNMAKAITTAANLLAQSTRTSPPKIMILVSDGEPEVYTSAPDYRARAETLEAAENARENQVLIITAGIGLTTDTGDFMRSSSADPSYFINAASSNALIGWFEHRAADICMITSTTTEAEPSLKIEIEVTPNPMLKQAYTVWMKVTNLGSSTVALQLEVYEEFEGNSTQLVGPAGNPWPLNAKTDPREHRASIEIKAGDTFPMDFRFRNEWNWIEPVDTTDRLVDLALLIMSTLFGGASTYTIAMLKIMVEAISTGKDGYDTLLGIFVGEFSEPSERFAVKAKASSQGIVLGATSEEVTVEVHGWKKAAFVNWIETCFASLILPIIAAVLAAIALTILTGGGAIPAWIIISQYVVTAVSAALLGASWALYDIAADPEADYLQFGVPAQSPIPPVVEQLPSGTGRDLAVAAFNYEYYLNASALEMARYGSAESAVRTAFMITHLQNAKSYLEKARSELAKMTSYYPDFRASLPELNSTSISMGRDYVKAKGLPDAAREVLRSLGADDMGPSLVKAIMEVPELVYQIPVDKLLYSASFAVESQIASIDKRIEALRQDCQTIDCPPDWLPYLYVVVPAALAVTIGAISAVHRRTSRRRPKIVGVSRGVVRTRRRTKDGPRIIEISRIEDQEKKG